MRLLTGLFITQTLLIIASYHFIFPTVLGINLDALIYFIHVTRLHQIINIAFLIGVWIQNSNKLGDIFYFFKSRHILALLVFLLTYLALLFLYLEILPRDYLYRRGFFLLVTAGVVGFPYAFPKELFRNPVSFINSEFSFELLGKWHQTLPINEPETGTFILGGQGSGKTKSLIEPMLFKMISKGYSGILYDYDFHPNITKGKFSLSHLVHHCIENFTGSHIKPNFLLINVEDLTKSARVNPIAPAFIQDRDNLSQAIYSLLLSLIPKRAEKQDFWYDNTVALFKSIVVFLANKYPEYCTLPHAIQLGLQENEILMAAIASDEESNAYASAVFDAFKGAGEQFTGVISSLKTSLDKLLNKNFF